ncbi:MAG TPA: hypothetical protein VNO21_18685, partial [Polyangiaceae bacterium]|nr:hypothetical protein [Polyangiaceae bacterium]
MIARLAALLLAALLASGCDDPGRKRESAATTASSVSASASTHAASPPPPEPEKPHLRTVLAHFKKPKGLAVTGNAAYVMDAVSGDREQNEILDLFHLALPSPASPKASLPSPASPKGDVEPQRLATKLRAAGSPLVLDGESYFAVGGDKPNGASDRLMKIGAGAASPVQVAPKALALSDPAVATDGTNLYFLAAADDKSKLDVMRIPLAGGKAVKLASGDRSARVFFVVADKKYVYWPEAGRVAKVPVAGGAPSEVAKVVYAWAAASDGSYLYWS